MATCPSCRKRYPDDATTCEADGERLLPDEAFASADRELTAGAKIGEYQVESKIGEGGFGSVYRAVHPLIGKAAAIKVLDRQYSSNPQMVSRFIAEARAVNQIRSRNIIDIFSFGALEDGRQYYVMELLDGMPLDRYLRERGRLSPEEAVPILKGIAKALDAAHGHGIAHRDLKPENVFVVIEDDGATFPKLLDFGIAKLLGESLTGHKTRTGTPMGTPHYMSPEQCRGKNVNHRTDLYSLGVLVHQALTGRVPFDGDDVMDILFKQTSAPAPPMSTVCPELPPALDAPVLHMLEKDPTKRPATAMAAVEEFMSAAREAGFAIEASPRAATSRSGPAVGAQGASHATPAFVTPAPSTPTADIASAKTMLQPAAQKTLMASESEVKAAPPSRTMLFVVLGVGALGITGAAFAFRSNGAGSAPSNGAGKVSSAMAAVSEAPAITADPPAASSSSAAAAESAIPIVAPAGTPMQEAAAPPAEVELTFEANVPGVEVWSGTKKLGALPGPIRVPRGETPLKLTFKAAGFAPLAREVGVDKNQTVKIELAKPQAQKKLNKDLEY